MMVVFTMDFMPYELQVQGWHWALIIPLALVVGSHILLPVRFFGFFFVGGARANGSVLLLDRA